MVNVLFGVSFRDLGTFTTEGTEALRATLRKYFFILRPSLWCAEHLCGLSGESFFGVFSLVIFHHRGHRGALRYTEEIYLFLKILQMVACSFYLTTNFPLI